MVAVNRARINEYLAALQLKVEIEDGKKLAPGAKDVSDLAAYEKFLTDHRAKLEELRGQMTEQERMAASTEYRTWFTNYLRS